MTLSITSTTHRLRLKCGQKSIANAKRKLRDIGKEKREKPEERKLRNLDQAQAAALGESSREGTTKAESVRTDLSKDTITTIVSI